MDCAAAAAATEGRRTQSCATSGSDGVHNTTTILSVHVSEALQLHAAGVDGDRDDGENSESRIIMEGAPEENHRMSFFSKELIQFSLFGRIHPKTKRPGNDLLSSKVAEVQELYKNIPNMLYFSPSSVCFNGIGIYTTNHLPKETVLGPYVGQEVQAEVVQQQNHHNECLWEIYQDSALACFVDASNPKYGNWMNFIQCARSQTEQNLKVMQVDSQLYFEAIRDVAVGEELLVWYDDSQYELHMGVPIAYKGTKKTPEQQRTTGMNSHMPTRASVSSHTFSFSNIAQSCTADTRSNSTPGHSVPMHTEDSTTTTNVEAVHYDRGSVSGRTTPLLQLRQQAWSTDNSEPPVNQSNGFLSHAIDHNDVSMNSGSGDVPSPNHSGFSGLEENNSSLQLNKTSGRHPTLNGSLNNIKETTALGSGTNGVTSQQHLPPPDQQGQQLSDPWSPPSSGGTLMQQQQQQQQNSNGTGPHQNKKQPPSLLYGMFSRCEDGSRWQCEECKRLFSSQGSLRAHSRIHTGERPYRCQYCFRTFCQASTLRSHERLHTGEKPYKCKHCGRAFTQSAGLRSHLKTHRYDTL